MKTEREIGRPLLNGNRIIILPHNWQNKAKKVKHFNIGLRRVSAGGEEAHVRREPIEDRKRSGLLRYHILASRMRLSDSGDWFRVRLRRRCVFR